MMNPIARFDVHTHTEYSNLRLKDSINQIETIANRAIEIGLKGIAITEHDCLSGSVRLNKYAQQLQKNHLDFKLAIGNEIYLCPNRNKQQKYYHFLLIAKNKQGYQALKELSSIAWLNMYEDRRMERVVTLFSDLAKIVKKYPNSLIASSACLGGLLSSSILKLLEYRNLKQRQQEIEQYNIIVSFVNYCQKLFKNDFYLEIAPACSKEQIQVNQMMIKISQTFHIPIVIGSDAHYLKKEDRPIHEAFLQSKDGEREVASFYEYCYLQTNEEALAHLRMSYGKQTEQLFNEFATNSMQIYNKIENYDLFHTQQIPTVLIQDYPKKEVVLNNEYPQLQAMFKSDNMMDRYWINQCWDKLNEIFDDPLKTKKEYLQELEEEAKVKAEIGKKLNTNIFGYPVLLQYYIDMMWECGSPVGAGRGSSNAALNHWLLGITQLDPIKWNLPFFRYLNKERSDALPDIDIDISPIKRPLILQKIREERSLHYLDKNLDDLSLNNLGCAMVATFKTEVSRSAILTGCRGYRSKEYPNGIDVETAQYLSSLIPIERGFAWSLSDVVYGNIEKDRKPITSFIQKIKKFDGLLDIVFGIEGLISGRSSHASGVILFDGNPYEHCCFMRTPKGEIITQYDLHDAEFCGSTKIDLLVTGMMDKIAQTLKFLQQDNVIESNLTLREAYNKYLHPDILPIDDAATWKTIQQANSLSLFQLDSQIGRQGAKKVLPTNILELSATNGLIRLMTAEKGQETLIEKYVRFKKHPEQWDEEMREYQLTIHEQEVVKKYLQETYGIGISQEQLMQSLMDIEICNFTLKEANQARKIVAKKDIKAIPELKKLVMKKATSPQMGKYIWEAVVSPQLGYSFSSIHSLAYSFIGFQSAYLPTHWNSIYWNTACLLSDSESLQNERENDDNNLELKEKSSDYAKIAKALGNIVNKNIKISLIDINNSDYMFSPFVENNEILFGLKGVARLNKDTIKQIKNGRPYSGIKDFINRCKINKMAMIMLIKAGAFDKTDHEWSSRLCREPRRGIMAYYLMRISELKQKINLQNLNALINYHILPKALQLQAQLFLINKELKKKRIEGYYIISSSLEKIIEKQYIDIYQEIIFQQNKIMIAQNAWNDFYNQQMQIIKNWIAENHDDILIKLNQHIFMENWNKYAAGTLSAWEMESICFYYHQHELANVDKQLYGISTFKDLPNKPIDKYFKQTIPIYKISKIIGTIIAKDDIRHSVSLLTPDSGVVNVKFNKEYYAMFKGRLSEIQEDGKKRLLEEGWFTRGKKILVCGYRREDDFVAKTYKDSHCHTLYIIEKINQNGTITLTYERSK